MFPRNIYIGLLLLLSQSVVLMAEDASLTARYTLDQCRQMAIDASNNSEMRTEALEAARLNKQAALAALRPDAGQKNAEMSTRQTG